MTRPAASPPTNDQGVPVAPGRPSPWRHALWLLVMVVLVVAFIVLPATQGRGVTTLTYSQFLSDVTAHKIKTVDIQTDGDATGSLADGTDYATVIPPQAGEEFLHQLQEGGVEITADSSATSAGSEIFTALLFLLPFVLIGYLWWRMSKRGGMGLQGAMGVGRSKAKVFDEERPKTTFADVAGYDGAKQEIREVVDFLQHPGRYEKAGAIAPRGILMVGPPGTGKTLLARAVAGEAAVPFFSVTGSSFVEMFVGVGAARVRDLFEEARNAPRRSSSSMRWMRSGSGGVACGPWCRTTSASRPSTSCSPRWTASTPPPASSSWPPPTDPRCWTRPCSVRDASTGRW